MIRPVNSSFCFIRYWGLGPLVLCLMLFSACNRSGPSNSQVASDGLRIQHGGEPVSIDPSLAEDLLGFQIIANTQDTLLGYNGRAELEPRLAEKWSVSSDGLQYRFHLRADARWSDGQPLTPKDFEFGIKRTIDPKTGARFGYFLERIRSISVDPKNPQVLVIELKDKLSSLLHALTFVLAVPQRADQLALKPDERVSSGVYRITQHLLDQKYELELNPFHWRVTSDPKAGWVPRITLIVAREDNTALSLFESGSLDLLTRVGPLDMKRLQEKNQLESRPFFATFFLGLNFKKPPFDDPIARRAFAGAINRKEIAQALGGGEAPARTFLPKGIEGYQGTDPSPEARKGFEEAIAEIKRRPKPAAPVVIQYDSNARNQLVLEKVQQDVKRALGWDVKLEGYDWKTHIRTMQTNPAHAYRFGWLTPFHDPLPYLLAFTSKSKSNYGAYRSQRYDELVDLALKTPSGAERVKWITESEALLAEQDVALVPVFHYVQNQGVSDRVGGYHVTPFGIINFHELRRK